MDFHCSNVAASRHWKKLVISLDRPKHTPETSWRERLPLQKGKLRACSKWLAMWVYLRMESLLQGSQRPHEPLHQGPPRLSAGAAFGKGRYQKVIVKRCKQ